MLAEKANCSGCGACTASCSLNCIEMEMDKEGFRYPQVDTDRCIGCDLCESVCPVLNPLLVADHTDFLAAQHHDIDLRLQSSSGGVFSALAENILLQGGAVCAAAYTDDFAVVHFVSRDSTDLPRFRGAKYTQSYAEPCFPEIRQLLRDEIPVLFVGTPCQTAGLKSYLGKEFENLLLLDMVCHGVPSPMVWKKYLKEQTEKAGTAITGINQRSKTSGWSRYGYSVERHHANGTVDSVKQGQDWFMRGFTGDLFLRPSCSNCAFKGVERCSDLTLGDCWGIWDTHPEFDDNKGTSLLLLQTEKGRAAWNGIQEAFEWIKIDKADAVRYNPSIVRSSAAHPARQAFFERLDAGENLTDLVKAYLSPPEPPRVSLLRRIKDKLLPRK